LLLLGLSLGFLVSGIAYAARALSFSGMIAAGLLGGITFGMGGWRPAVILIWFFVSSSLLTRIFQRQKRAASMEYAKGGARDMAQVLANGGLAGLAVAIYALTSTQFALYAFTGALAVANADTWATELGVLSRRPPRLITNGKRVLAGTSGAVSWPGLLASLAGAGTIAALAGFLYGDPRLVPAGMAAGFLGSCLDSFLGACCQRVYYCPECAKETEQHPQHRCGATTEALRGYAWLENDMVNALATFSGALLTVIFALLS
jgi:uncharacterized protein (TIGR00297 family)